MGQQIIKQPDGKYAVWSSIVDNFTYINCTPEEIIEVWVQEAREDITRMVTSKVEALNAGKQPYYQFTKTWEECLEEIESRHGKAKLHKILKGIITEKER